MDGDACDRPDETVGEMTMPRPAAVRALPPSDLVGDNMEDAVRAEKGTRDVGSLKSFMDETVAGQRPQTTPGGAIVHAFPNTTENITLCPVARGAAEGKKAFGIRRIEKDGLDNGGVTTGSGGGHAVATFLPSAAAIDAAQWS